MASSKTFILLGLLFAVTLLISSQVSARELIESTATATTSLTESVQESKFGHYGHGHYGHGSFGHGGHYPPEEENKEVIDPQYYGHGGGYGGYGHGGYGHGGYGHGGYGHGGYGGYGHGGYGHGGYGGYGHGGYGHGGYGHGGYGHGGYGGHYPPKEEMTTEQKGN